MKFELEKPGLNQPDLITQAILKVRNSQDQKVVLKFIKTFIDQEYLYWDTFRYKEPLPEAFGKEELWILIKHLRQLERRDSIIRDTHGKFFSWAKLNYFDEFFHELDMDTGGTLLVEKNNINETSKQKLMMRGIMEEAIASSQLEGAATSRQAAKKMLREGRKPINHSEKMILNNYISMQAIEENYRHKELSVELILELHGLVTKEMVDSSNEKPRLRQEDEPVYITNSIGTIYYEAPNADFVEKEMKRLISFANDEDKDQAFIHPIIKAIMLHFWVGYLHPFTDGNGRLARLLFYWYLIKNGYWAFVYLPISKVIKKSPKQYIMAYVYSEQDENDLTYFIDYHIKKIKIAVDDFKKYLVKQTHSNVKMKQASEIKYHFNLRQIQLLQYLHGNSEEHTTFQTHRSVNKIGKATASRDLKDLVKKGFLMVNKRGRNVYYLGTGKIKELF